MKKFFMMAAVACMLITAASCGNKTAQNSKTTDSENVATDSTASKMEAAQVPEATAVLSELGEKLNSKDPKVIATVTEKIKSQIKAYIDKGDIETANKYAAQVKTYLKEHAEQIKTATKGETATLDDLVNSVSNIPTNAANAATEAGQTVKSDAENAANGAVSTAKNAAATNKVNAAKQAATDKANSAVNSAHKKASDAVNKANKKANDAVNSAADKAIKGIGL